MPEHRGDFDKGFYEAVIGETLGFPVGAALAQTSDADGALSPARWLVYLVNPTSPTAKCWVYTGKFTKGATLAPVNLAAPGPTRILLTPSGVVAVEHQVITGESDRIAAAMTGGTGELYMTRISTVTRKAKASG